MMLEGERHRPLVLTFEAISALTMAGLSVNRTLQLSSSSKPILMGLMFLGRVGCLFLLLTRQPAQPSKIRRPEEPDLVVG